MNKKKTKKKTKRKTFRKKPESVQGVLFFSRSGDAFFNAGDGRRFFVPKRFVGLAFDGDRAEGVPLRVGFAAPGKLPELKVVKILTQKRKLVGTAKYDGKSDFLRFVPRGGKNSHFDFRVKKGDLKLADGDLLLVETDYFDSKTSVFFVRPVKVLGAKGSFKAENKALLLRYGFEDEFSKRALYHAEDLRAAAESEPVEKYREDLRDLPTVTVDPKDAKDFDDAVSLVKRKNSYELYVHIADVTHFVKFDDPIDKEARKRCTSVYLVGHTSPMLPEILSNDLCSLNPNEDKLAFSVIFSLNEDLSLKSYRFAKTLIRSKKRFTYEEAQKAIEDNAHPQHEFFATLNEFARKERRKRERAGVMDFESAEYVFELDKNGEPVSMQVKKRLDSMKMIEDIMLAANRAVAEHMRKHIEKRPNSPEIFIFRVHDSPDPEKLKELESFLSALGFDLSVKRALLGPKELSDLLKMLKGEPIVPSLERAILQAMAKARYSHKNIGHFSLAFSDYTHFTSPIRRYPDIMAHRILWASLKGEKLSNAELAAYKKLAEKSSEKEIDAMRAERESVRRMQVKYFARFLGEEFNVVLSGMTRNGIFLSEKESGVDGFAPFEKLDFAASYLEKEMAVLCEDGSLLRIGDEFKAKLKKVDVENAEIEWGELKRL